MPAKNSIKQYVGNAYYHIYNRGVEKRVIFLDDQDFSVFLSYLKDYLMPKDEKSLLERFSNPNTASKEKDKVLKLLKLNNFHGQISLISYCLMPNHFHFLIKQNSPDSMDRFMNSLATRYTMYFNKKYKRVGALYQDVYKAVLVVSEEQLLHLSRYIHKQALASQGDALQSWPSSAEDYLKKRNTKWIQTDEILSYFSKNNPSLSYEHFLLQENDFDLIKNILIEK